MSRPEPGSGGALRRLARLHGVQLSYTDVRGRRWRATEASLLHVLRALGEPLADHDDAGRALARAVRSRWAGCLDPVAVAWDGKRGRAILRGPAGALRGRWSGTLRLEDGRATSVEWEVGDAMRLELLEAGGERYGTVALPLPEPLPLGYHRLEIPRAQDRPEGWVLSAPTRAHEPPPGERRWGVFVPLHALSSSRSWGIGDYSDLASFVGWLGARGGGVLGTLPLLPTFLGRVHEPSPYSPVSRLFWSEAFLDLASAVDGEPDPEMRSEVEAVRASPLVDYLRVAALKRRALRSFGGGRSQAPGSDTRAYAAFRAASDEAGDWPAWPRSTARRTPPLPASDPEDAEVYVRAERMAADQVAETARIAEARGVHLYLDLPIGVHPSGFDTWYSPEVFVSGMSVGAPPDTVFTSGQNWGFPPPHPEGMRRDGYRYFAAVLRHEMESASMLRLDHVMGLHRLFWVPQGRPAKEGVYVRYRADELYAVLTLESTRNRCVVVGENLGTVPGYVNRSLRRHGIRPLYVVQYETEGSARRIPPRVPPGSVASMNTHDMPPFAAYWAGRDIGERVAAGLFPKDKAASERRRRARTRARIVRRLAAGGWLRGRPTTRAVYEAILRFLAASEAWAVLVNLEDLWGETESQNLPGTGPERPNWRRRLRYSLEEIEAMGRVAEVLARVDAIRKGQITYPNRAT